MQKAFQRLESNGKTYAFHDYKKVGAPTELLQTWIKEQGRGALINRQGLTWKKLNDEEKMQADTDAGALALMQKYPSMIRRPIIESGETRIIGYIEAQIDML